MINEMIIATSIMLSPITVKTDKVIIPLNLEVSAYCSCYECSEEWGDNTASGTKTRKGIIAAPIEIPFGTKMFIEDGIYIVEDRGGYIKKIENIYRIDKYMDSHKETLDYGRRLVKGYIVKGGDEIDTYTTDGGN